MSDVMVTVNGYVGTRPVVYRSATTGAEWTSFRLGSTRRVVNRATGEWADGPTIWFTVKAWRDAARNVAGSIDKGDPVVVHGRLAVEEWEGPDSRSHTTLVVLASALGPDVTRGTARFTRILTTQAPGPDGALPDGGTGDATDGGAGGSDGAGSDGAATGGEQVPGEGSTAADGLAGLQAPPVSDPWLVGGAGEGAGGGDGDGDGVDGRMDGDGAPDARAAGEGDESTGGGGVTHRAGRAGRRTA